MNLTHIKNKKVLITGHTGFVGSWLSMILHLKKIDFYGISLKPHFNNTLYNTMKKKKMTNISVLRTRIKFTSNYYLNTA